jgi:hypothetical protein
MLNLEHTFKFLAVYQLPKSGSALQPVPRLSGCPNPVFQEIKLLDKYRDGGWAASVVQPHLVEILIRWLHGRKLHAVGTGSGGFGGAAEEKRDPV